MFSVASTIPQNATDASTDFLHDALAVLKVGKNSHQLWTKWKQRVLYDWVMGNQTSDTNGQKATLKQPILRKL
jgi:hypothetical protein